MNTEHTTHPSDEELDAWRAELLDVDRAAELRAHVDTCARCAGEAGRWPGLLDTTTPPDLEQRLSGFRREALEAPVHTRHRAGIGLAVAASALLAVLSLQMLPVDEPAAPVPSVASQRPAAVPEVYEDVDFYRWLAGHEETSLALDSDRTGA